MKNTFFIFLQAFFISIASSQIYEPEGLNMPGSWNGWTNPPTNNLVFASSTQVVGGTITKITTGTLRWHTTIKVASSGGDITGGTYAFLFTSGPSVSPYNNKWGNVTVSMNTIQTYTYSSSASDNSITVVDGRWYTVNWKDNGYANTEAIFMETSAQPVTISSVTDNYTSPGTAVTVNITLNTSKSAEEKIFVRYTTDNWSTSSFVEATGSGTSYSATIPSEGVIGTSSNQYYVFTTTVSSPTHANADLITINYNNNSGVNYSLPVELTSFIANAVGKNVVLKWNTATEINNAGFEVERKVSSLDFARNSQWENIGFVEGHGTVNTPQEYTFIDSKISAGTYLYRLKQIDRDGKFEYSPQVEVTVAHLPNEFTLLQNYPNPFNPTTVIQFAIPTTQFATLKVYTALGQEVVTLFSGIAEGNKMHNVEFNGSTLPSGVYFYALKTKDRNEVKKLTLLK